MLKILSVVLKRKKYAIIAIVVGVIMAGVSYYLTVKNIYHNSIFAYADMNGTLFTVTSLFLGAAIAVLLGFHVALLIFRRDIVKARAVSNKAASFGGAVTGIFASGCPSCGAPVLGLMGFPLGLFSLPFRGIELKVFSIVFLVLAIFLISKNIKKNLACQLIENNSQIIKEKGVN